MALALAGSLCFFVHAVTGFTNKSLRGQVAGLLGTDYTSSQMSYDLRRLRLHGSIERTHGTNSFTVTPEVIRVAVFYNKLHGRLLRPLLDANQPPAPIELRRALGTIEHDSMTTLPTHVSGQLPETCHKIQRAGYQEDLAALCCAQRVEAGVRLLGRLPLTACDCFP